MSLKKSIFSSLIIFLVLVTGCSKNVVIDEKKGNLLNYDFEISDTQNIDETLINQKYCYSTHIDKEYIAIVTYKSKNASMRQYLISKDGIIDLTIPKDSDFIISLHANRTIAYTWNIKNNLDNGVIQFKNRSWIDIPMPESEKGKTGVNYGRQNFYFKSIESGNEKVVMRYEHETEKRNEFFEVTLNIKIE